MIETDRQTSEQNRVAHVFGPVRSSRLGRVLCANLVPMKLCNYDCIYCEHGNTTRKTVSRDMYCDFDRVVEEIGEHLWLEPEYIALTGPGEPVMQAQLNQLMQQLRAITDVPIAVLTNGGLLWRADIRAELMDADIVLPCLDAGDNATLKAVNRPHARISIDDIIDGMIRFRRRYRNRPSWLRVTRVGGVNDSPQSLDRIRRAVRRVEPDRVHLRTASVPHLEESSDIDPERLESIAAYMGPTTEIIPDAATAHADRQMRGATA